MEPNPPPVGRRHHSAAMLPYTDQVGTSSDLQVGQTVLAIGKPSGLDYYALLPYPPLWSRTHL